MKIFISQPMRGRDDFEIQTERNNTITKLKNTYYDADVEILDTFFGDFNGNAVQFLGKSVSKLGEADLAVFLPGWAEARGCRMEELIAYTYGIKRLYL